MTDAPSMISAIVGGDHVLSLPVVDYSESTIGELRPLTVSSLNDDGLMESITKWRNAASKSFLTQFEATPDRTRRWLQDVVLRDDSRLLFLLHSTTRIVGHYGFKNLTHESAEVDNLVRGEAGGHPQLIHFAEVALVKWLFSTFGISRLYGYVFGGNWQALDLHARVGFENSDLIPLVRMETGGETRFEMGKSGLESPEGLYSQKITLSRDSFTARGFST